VNVEDEAKSSTKQLKLLQMSYPGDWREHLNKINAQIMKENDPIVAS